ncbi:MAG TPA: response regulator transcription factor [Saprospiraceae bacterium]|jgi:DNA-binding LytR/AlgR family response regulator|nr:response regulator transcription factor [Saprospiraceae bacterium]
MNVIIIEDEQYAFDKLSLLLSRLDNNINIVGHAKSIKHAVALIENNDEIDLAFFDIQLSDGLSFSIFDRIEFSFPIIFTTAYDNHAIRAFKHNSIDYLLKPIRKADLEMAIQKFDRLWKPDKSQGEAIKNLQKLEQKSYKERFVIKVGEHIKMIKASDISCFYSMDKTTYLLTADDRNYHVDFTLEEIIETINSRQFYRVNRKFIINLNFIKDIISYSNSRLKVSLKTKVDDDIIVSRERVKGFKNWLGE